MIVIGLVIGLNLVMTLCCCKASGNTERDYEEWSRR